jgi:predicted RNA-binding protein YlxR (DUF448 family)
LASGVWTADPASSRAPGRGAYLCSSRCAERVRKNKRFAGLASAAQGVAWIASSSALCVDAEAVYDSRVPP